MRIPNIDTQQSHILYMLLNNEVVYNKDLTVKLNTSNPGSRISELRLKGWDVLDKPLNFHSTEKSYFFDKDYRRHLLQDHRIQNFMKMMKRYIL